MLARAENKISRLILFGIPPGTRTLTSGFGDRRAAVTPGACRCTGRGGGGDGWSRTSSLRKKRFYRPPRLTICAASPLQGRSISPAAISRIGLGDRDRTCGLTLPKRVLYLLSYTQRSRSRLRNGLHVANYRGCPGATVSYRLGALPHDRSAAFVGAAPGFLPCHFACSGGNRTRASNLSLPTSSCPTKRAHHD